MAAPARPARSSTSSRRPPSRARARPPSTPSRAASRTVPIGGEAGGEAMACGGQRRWRSMTLGGRRGRSNSGTGQGGALRFGAQRHPGRHGQRVELISPASVPPPSVAVRPSARSTPPDKAELDAGWPRARAWPSRTGPPPSARAAPAGEIDPGQRQRRAQVGQRQRQVSSLIRPVIAAPVSVAASTSEPPARSDPRRGRTLGGGAAAGGAGKLGDEASEPSPSRVPAPGRPSGGEAGRRDGAA